jgi:hypothetical protein
MAFWVSRIVLKSGELATERELRLDENYFDGPAPVVGDRLTVLYQGRAFEAEVIWGNWPGLNEKRNPSDVARLRVAEVYRNSVGRSVLAEMDPDAPIRALNRWRAKDPEERQAGGIFQLMSSRKPTDG